MRLASLLAIVAHAAVIAATLGPGAAAPGGAAAEADQLAGEARARAAAGDFVGAAVGFRAAHALDPRPDLLCNVGVAFHKARELPRAHLYLGQCMARVGSLEAGFAASVRSAFAAVEDTLRAGPFAPIDVTVTPGTAAFTVSAFDPEDAIVGARVVWLPYGTHTVDARAEGHAPVTVEVTISAPGQQPVRIVLERTPASDPDPGAGSGPADPGGPGAGQHPPAGSRRTAMIVTGATGVLAIGAVGSYLLARSAAADAGEVGITEPEYDARVERARFRQHLSWGLGGAAVLGAAASSWLWYRATRTGAVTVDVTATDGGATATIRGRF